MPMQERRIYVVSTWLLNIDARHFSAAIWLVACAVRPNPHRQQPEPGPCELSRIVSLRSSAIPTPPMAQRIAYWSYSVDRKTGGKMDGNSEIVPAMELARLIPRRLVSSRLDRFTSSFIFLLVLLSIDR